jgi:hypothetical protein
LIGKRATKVHTRKRLPPSACLAGGRRATPFKVNAVQGQPDVIAVGAKRAPDTPMAMTLGAGRDPARLDADGCRGAYW